MRLSILGAGGGLGRNAVDAALAAGHEVTALVRDRARAALPPEVRVIDGDAANADEIAGAITGCEATLYCVNPPFAQWATLFPPLLDAAIEAARRTGTRLVFPANVWIYGPGRAGERVDEQRAASPTSERGRLRLALERRLETAPSYAIVRLPEFYGPSVVTLTARVFRAALAGKRAWWPGKLDVPIEVIYMPDAARAMVAIATATDADRQTFHVPGGHTTARQLLSAIFEAAGTRPRLHGVPPWVLSTVGLVDATVRGAADIGHLWTDPILLDGARYRARFGEVPCTPYPEGIRATLAWHRAHPTLKLH